MNPLTYCSNIHPGESWADVLQNLNSHAIAVKQQYSPTQAFPLGLRISHQASQEIGSAEIAQFHDWCKTHNCYLLTINGFPYGTFHQQPVKSAVYEPDWRKPERVAYTKRLADLALMLASEARELSISTVPVAFKPGFAESDWPVVRENLLECLAHLHNLYRQSGIKVRLALEPEPLCVLETIPETVAFFTRMDFPVELQEFIGICFDCCHQAVEFEDPAACLAQLREANIAIVKVQVSSALCASGDEIPGLLKFNEPVYLHQVVAKPKDGKSLERFIDLPDFQQRLQSGAEFSECRAHFHVPIFLQHLGYCGTTRFFLEDFLPQLDPSIPLEVETYSFKNLPEHLRKDSLSESIARELLWVKDLFASSVRVL
ncbi:MAG TPA: metabolite traffic protein EboE [Cellvibrio sp.]|nr:metabolite traffic protein EboE [Cellvibrio sp.]